MTGRCRALAVAPVLFVLSSCEPCSGTAGCTRVPVAAVVGRIVDDAGKPVANVRLSLAPRSGISLQGPAETATDRDGLFRLSVAAADLGDAIVAVTVSAPNRRPYTVPDLRVPATVTAGSALVLPPWVDASPMFPYVLILYREGTENGIPNTAVEFRPTAGPTMLHSDTTVTVVRGTTDSFGWVYLLRGLTTDSTGTVTGDLTLRFAPGDSVVLPQVTWTSVPRFHQPTTIVTVSLPRP